MIRLIGILTGSAIAVSFLIIALGVPEFNTPERTSPDPSIVNMTPVASESAPVSEPETQPEPEVIEMTEPHPEPDDIGVPATLSVAEPEPEPIAVVEEVQEKAAQQWYAFWSPFRSEIAADGFVSQLQRTTGLDYRVVKLKPGVYEVAFAYSDDADIQDKLTQISSATGLDLSGG